MNMWRNKWRLRQRFGDECCFVISEENETLYELKTIGREKMINV